MTLPPANIFPPQDRDLLIRASEVEPHLPPGDSEKRAYVIDSIVRHLRIGYPQLFASEEE